MRLHIISDIHDDYSRGSLGNYQIPEGLPADAILIAGDIAGRLSRMGRTWLEHQAARTGLPIIICAGNHDFWRGSLTEEIGRFRDRLQRSDIHILDGESFEIGGTRIIGATLWTDYALSGDERAAQLEGMRTMNDFAYIRTADYERRLMAWMLLDEHERQRDAIASILSTPFDGPTICMTHHAPSARSLMTDGPIQPIDASYASDLEPLIREHSPLAWIHGHTHRRLDYCIGDTRILCNPRGYRHAAHQRRPAEIEYADFDERLIFDTDDIRPLATGANIDIAYDRASDFQWPYGREPIAISDEEREAGYRMMRERADRGENDALLRRLTSLPDCDDE